MSECSAFNPSAEQITAALRCCGNTDTKKPDCEHCPLLSVRMCVKVMLEGAADLIAQLNDFDQTQSKIALERCQRAETQLAESQRRERAAVKDLRDHAAFAATCGRYGCGYDCQSPRCPGWEWRGPQKAGKGEAE